MIMENVKLMFEIRNYIISSENENFIIFNQNIIFFKQLQEKITIQNLKDYILETQNSYPHIIFLYKTITPITKELINQINHNQNGDNKNINNFIKQYVDKKIKIEIFFYLNFTFDILSHYLQPKIKVLSVEESKNFKWKNIQCIKTIDPIVKYFNLELKRIIEYEYENKIYYRIVNNEEIIKSQNNIDLNNDNKSIILSETDSLDEDEEEEIMEEEIIEEEI